MFDNYPEGLSKYDWEHIYGGCEMSEEDKRYERDLAYADRHDGDLED